MPKGDKSIPKTHEQFLLDFFKKQPELSNSIKIIGTYKSAISPILVKTKYGECLVQPSNLLSGKTPTIQSAVNKDKYFKNELKDKQPKIFHDIEIIQQYENAKKHILVKTKYGVCSVTPDKLLRGIQPTIKSAINKNVYFENELKDKQPLLFNNIKIIGKYVENNKHILINTKYGKCLSTSSSLLMGNLPTIKSAVNKTEYFKNELRDLQPQLFDSIEIIEEYKEAQQYLLVKTKYGICKTKPTYLLGGKIPNIVNAINPNGYFTNQAQEVHGNDLYDYSLINYLGNNKKVLIKSKFGIFLQLPGNHLAGHGCPSIKHQSTFCHQSYINRALKSNRFDSFKVYIIKCWNDDKSEIFYKIGKTYQTVKQRFNDKKQFPYNYKILKVITFEKTFEEGMYCCKLEYELQAKNKEFQYIPKEKFGGRYECFSDLKEFI